MGLFKVLGGIALGVGAVAAAPFTGGGSIIGAASLAGSLAGAGAIAAGAGVVGGVAASALSKKEEEESTWERSRAFEQGVSAGEGKVKEKLERVMSDAKKRDEFLIAGTALGIAVAQCDGEIAEEELLEMQTFIGDINNMPHIPDATKGRISMIVEMKPDLKTSFSFLDKVDNESLEFLDKMVDVMIMADGKLHDAELTLKREWKDYIVSKGL